MENEFKEDWGFVVTVTEADLVTYGEAKDSDTTILTGLDRD